MKCKLNGNEIESLFPCSSNCPLFGDCLVQYENESEKRSQPTNADRIRAMSDEELAKFIPKGLVHVPTSRLEIAIPAWLEWLQQPAEEDDHEND